MPDSKQVNKIKNKGSDFSKFQYILQFDGAC